MPPGRALWALIATLAEELGPLAPDELQLHLTDRLVELLGPTGLLADHDGSGDASAGDVDVSVLCGDPAVPCDDTFSKTDIVDVQIRLGLADSGTVTLSTDGFDLGLDGVRMQAAPGQDIAVDSSWAVDLGFGMSDADGFYASTTAADGFDGTELHSTRSSPCPPGCRERSPSCPSPGCDRLGPDAQLRLDVALAGGTGGRLTLAALQATPDPQDPTEVTAELCGGIALDRTLSVGGEVMGDAALPKVSAGFGSRGTSHPAGRPP